MILGAFRRRARSALFMAALAPVLAALAFTAALSPSNTAQAEPDAACAPIFDALTKMLRTPNHQFMSQSSATYALQHGGQLRTGESITTKDASYVKMMDTWQKVPFTPEEMVEQQEEARRNAKSVCHFLHNDPAEGDVQVYETQSATEKGKSDIQIWISKTSGLPLREEIDLDLADAGKSHSSVRFDYDHVDLPPEVKSSAPKPEPGQ